MPILSPFQAGVDAPCELVSHLIWRMLNTSPPLLVETGYSSIVLVSSMFLQPWTVIVSEDPRTRVFPRRWLDVVGAKVQDFWEAALRAVIGVIVFRPGVSQVCTLFLPWCQTLPSGSFIDRTSLALEVGVRQTRSY